MNRRVFILSPLIFFLLSAALAWLLGKDDGGTFAKGIDPRESPRHAAARQQADPIETVLARMENRIFTPAAKPTTWEACNAKDMENLLGMLGSSHWSWMSMHAMEYAEQWAEQAPEEMLAWVLRRNETRIMPCVRRLFGTWAKNDLKAAVSAWEKIPNLELRGQALVGVLPALHAADPERAQSLLLDHLGLFAGGDLPVLSWPVDADRVAGCVELLDAIPESRERTRLRAGLLRSVDDAKSRRACWEGIPETERRGIIAINGMWHSGWEHLEGYVALAREHAEESGNLQLVNQFVNQCGARWAECDLEGALAWLDAHGKGRNQAHFRQKLMRAAAAADLDNTIRVWREYPDGYRKKALIDSISAGAPGGRKRETRMQLENEMLR